jgi:hypothetical protein
MRKKSVAAMDQINLKNKKIGSMCRCRKAATRVLIGKNFEVHEVGSDVHLKAIKKGGIRGYCCGRDECRMETINVRRQWEREDL